MGATRVACQRGFTLVEALAASLILVVGVLTVLALVDNANSRSVATKGREAATGLSRQLIEDVRDIPYTQLVQGTIASQLQANSGLESAPGSTMYTIKRRGFTYSIDAATCTIDDPRDGIGPEGAGFCGNSQTGGGGSNGSTCSGAIAASGNANVDVNGNNIDTSFCLTLSNSLVWSTCNLLNTTLAAQASASLAAILGSLLQAQAQAAASATVCGSGSSPAVAADTQPDDYKLVMIEVRWGAHKVKQATIIANPGSSAGPAVTDLHATSGSTTVSNSGTTSVGFSATTSTTPASVTWTRDGGSQGTASGSATSWSFSWPLGPATDPNGALDPSTVLDGSYVIGARAFDTFGVSGPGRSVTMTINRSLPRKVTGVAAGRNNNVVEVEWQPNPERDIIGYRVYRGTGTLVCSLTSSTNCRDASPPNVTTPYWVVAVDRDTAGNAREGTVWDAQSVTTSNPAPCPPTALQASTSAGTTILRWTAPLVALCPVDFFRIYRDGSTYASRYDRTGAGTDVTYTDTATGGVSHTYYVTSVHNLAESTLLGPVTR